MAITDFSTPVITTRIDGGSRSLGTDFGYKGSAEAEPSFLSAQLQSVAHFVYDSTFGMKPLVDAAEHLTKGPRVALADGLGRASYLVTGPLAWLANQI